MKEFPQTIDINPTAECNLRCTFCWGPDHTIPDALTTDDWEKVISFFALRGTKSVVFTGGEPLIRKDLVELLRHAKLQGMRTTLSTNTILLNEARAHELLPYIDEIGIPIDGSTAEKNRRMRIPVNPRAKGKHFINVMEALPRVKHLAPDIDITIRTVVSRVNQDDIMDIGRLLHTMPDVWNKWKLYQFTPVSIGAEHEEEHNMPRELFQTIGKEVCEMWPTSNIKVYASDDRTGQYVFLGPEGSIFGVGDDGMYKQLGIFQDMGEPQIIEAVHSLLIPTDNRGHGVQR